MTLVSPPGVTLRTRWRYESPAPPAPAGKLPGAASPGAATLGASLGAAALGESPLDASALGAGAATLALGGAADLDASWGGAVAPPTGIVPGAATGERWEPTI